MTRVRVDYELSDEIEVKVGMHQVSELSPLLLAVIIDVVNEFAREGPLSELQYADDLVQRKIQSRDSGISSWNGRMLLTARIYNQPWKNQGNGQRRHHIEWHVKEYS